MSLTLKEKQGIKKILEKLQLEELNSLTFTITKGLVKAETKAESLEAILLYCEAPSLLLRRRKVKKEVIFAYLKSEGIPVSINGNKSVFVKACLNHWNSQESQNALDQLDCEMDEGDNLVFQSSTVFEVKGIPDLSELLLLGQSFAVWFYNLMNKINTSGDGEPFKSDHLWPDCVLKWHFQDRTSMKSGAIQTSRNVSKFLTTVIGSNALRFDPSIPTISSKYSEYGVIEVMVEGTVHQNSNSVGLFKQLFGLVKDPQEMDSWKIKFSEIQLQINCALFLI